jgi:hypothetical protein
MSSDKEERIDEENGGELSPEVHTSNVEEKVETEKTMKRNKNLPKAIKIVFLGLILVAIIVGVAVPLTRPMEREEDVNILTEELARAEIKKMEFRRKKFSAPLPEFNSAILDGYEDCDGLINDIENALSELANIRIQSDMCNFASPFGDVLIDVVGVTLGVEPFFEPVFDENLVPGDTVADSTTGMEPVAIENGESFMADDQSFDDVSGGGEDSFGTNNQNENVDEADMIKSDGTYVYTVYGSDIVVLDLVGTERFRLELVEKDDSFSWWHDDYIQFEDSGNGTASSSEAETITVSVSSNGKRAGSFHKSIESLMLFENRLVAFVSSNNWFYSSVSSFTTEIILIDINLTNGELSIIERKSVNGIYQAARMIEPNIHLVTTSYIQTWEFTSEFARWQNEFVGMGARKYAEKAFAKAESIIPKYAKALARELLSDEAPIDKKGDLDDDLIFPQDTCKNIAKLSSYQNGKSDDDVDWTDLQGTLNGFVRVTSFNITSGLNDTASTSAAFVPTAHADVYATEDMLFLGGRGWAANPEDASRSQDVTYITAFRFSGASATLNATGFVPGYTINQFSFDFFDGHLRVATTTSADWSWNPLFGTSEILSNSTNQIVVTAIEDNELKIVGKLEGLGETEVIYAVRFLGDRAFMVTFRQTDPFYAIDLSVPEAPVMRGELKIPGFSNYLHPVDDDFILAVGQDANELGMTLGLQIALFNVSDLDDPKQIGKKVVDGWSFSESQNDHHAFRYLPLTKKLILPISSAVFDGFHVYDINTTFSDNQGSIELDFNISHFDSKNPHLLCYGINYLRPRSLVFQGDVMTFKGHSVLSHDLESGDMLFEIDLDEGLNNTDMCYGWFF